MNYLALPNLSFLICININTCLHGLLQGMSEIKLLAQNRHSDTSAILFSALPAVLTHTLSTCEYTHLHTCTHMSKSSSKALGWVTRAPQLVETQSIDCLHSQRLTLEQMAQPSIQLKFSIAIFILFYKDKLATLDP